jgi:hypothetical protein
MEGGCGTQPALGGRPVTLRAAPPRLPTPPRCLGGMLESPMWCFRPAIACVLACCLVPAAAAADRPTRVEDRLDAAVQATWTKVPLRDWTNRITHLAGKPVVLDRRLDPERRVTFVARGEPLRGVLAQVAAAAGARVTELRGSIRIVPTEVADLALHAERDRLASLGQMPARCRIVLNEQQSWQWPTGARPRDLVARAATEAGVALEGLDRVPHDHFPAAALPPLSLAERLDLVLAHFDHRVAWRVDRGKPVGRIVPIRAADAGSGGGAGANPSTTTPSATGSHSERAPSEPTRDGSSVVKPRPSPRPDRRRNDATKPVFSLQLEAPLDQAVAAIADRLGLVPEIDGTSLKARGIATEEIVRASVSQATRDQLLDAVLEPLSLGWTIEEDRLRVFASHPVARGPAPTDIAAAVAARRSLPSVHADREAIRTALVAAEVPPETVDSLFRAADRAERPGMVPSLDGFLFLTHEPGWRAFRRQFAEFLELRQVSAVSAELVQPLAGYAGVVTLPAISTLTVETATALAGFGGGDWAAAVEFPSVTSLEPDAAAAIAHCPALLVFPSLERLSVESAARLAQHEGIGLVLGGLTTLPDDVAAALAETASLQGLLLPDLTRIESVSLARRLARQDHVFLPKVTTLSPRIAEALQGSDGGELALPALQNLPPDVARTLVGGGYFWLVFGASTTLSPEAATILAKHPGQLTLTGAAAPDPAVAAALAPHAGTLRLPHLDRVSGDLATALGRHAGPLVLDAITHLDEADAAANAQSLVASPSILALPALRRVSAAALEVLLAKPGIQIPPLDSVEIVGPGGHHHEDVVRPEP